jgi:hypothetical protein
MIQGTIDDADSAAWKGTRGLIRITVYGALHTGKILQWPWRVNVGIRPRQNTGRRRSLVEISGNFYYDEQPSAAIGRLRRPAVVNGAANATSGVSALRASIP